MTTAPALERPGARAPVWRTTGHPARGVALLWCATLVALVACLALVSVDTPRIPAAPATRAIPAQALPAISGVLGRDNPEFHARAHGDSVVLVNSRNRLRAQFGPSGTLLRVGPTRIRLRLLGVGRGDELLGVPRARPRADRNRVEYRRGNLREWYVNGPAGVEQGFTISRAPREGAGGALTIALSGAPSVRLDREHRAATLGPRGRRPAVAYRGLWAVDSRGHDLPSWLDTRHGMLRLRVDDRGAKYPVTVDPIFQAAKLTASAGEPGDMMGNAVATSGDTIVVGSPLARSGDGAVYVFQRPAGGWVDAHEIATLTSATFGLGKAVAISGDTIVATEANNFDGDVAVFVRPPGGWRDARADARLRPKDGVYDESFGVSLAIDGDTIVTASTGYGYTTRAYVYVRPPEGWVDSLETTILLASDRIGDDGYGISAAIRGDTIAIGARPYLQGVRHPGGVYLYVRPTGGWPPQTSLEENRKLVAPDGGWFFGEALALTDDALFVSSPNDGAVVHGSDSTDFVYTKPPDGWASGPSPVPLSTSLSVYGLGTFRSSSIASDGAMVSTGWPYESATSDRQGALYVHARPTGLEGQSGPTRLTASDGAADDWFGYATAASANTTVTGAPGDDDRAGSAYVFVADSVAPTAPELAGVSPGSPANDNRPHLIGATEPHARVRVYMTSDCTGPPVADGDAALLLAGQLGVPVPDDSDNAFRATATDRAGNISTCSAPIQFTEDSTPPNTQIVAGPAGAGDDPTPTFTFRSQGGGDARFECSFDDAEFSACASPVTARALLEGAHRFSVRAVDRAGNRDPSPDVRSFSVDISAPIAVVAAVPRIASTSDSVRFDASRSSDPPAGTIVRHEWDLDGDGTYELDTGMSPVATRSYATAGERRPEVRLTNSFGRSSTARAAVSVRLTPPSGRVGVVIARGARRTRHASVSLRVIWPRLARSMMISNSRRFVPSDARNVTPTVRWTLPRSGRGAVRRTVYVRFDDSPRVYSDTIILNARR